MLEWAQLPISIEEWSSKVNAQQELFRNCKTLPGVPELLYDLSTYTSPRVYVALASSAGKRLFNIKTASLPAITSAISEKHRVFGDDPEMDGKSGKPAPDIFLLALRRINENIEPGEPPVMADECLVFEDSIAGVEAGRRAEMRVVWVPHSGLLEVCRKNEETVLMGSTFVKNGDSSPKWHELSSAEQHHNEMGDLQPRISEDGLAELLTSLEGFPYERYGICIRRSNK